VAAQKNTSLGKEKGDGLADAGTANVDGSEILEGTRHTANADA